MITPRLDMILRHAEGKSFADVGTDHAYIPIELTRRGGKVIATDIKKGPLLMAKKNAEKHGVEIELRLGSGLAPICAGEVECIIIAGMGGEMIEKILTEGMEVAKKSVLLLQPMNGQDTLRKFLAQNNFQIICEDIAVEGHKVYNFIKAKSGGRCKAGDEFSLHLPEYLYDHPLFFQLLKKKKREFTKILEGLLHGAKKDAAQIEKLQSFLDKIEEIERGFLI